MNEGSVEPPLRFTPTRHAFSNLLVLICQYASTCNPIVINLEILRLLMHRHYGDFLELKIRNAFLKMRASNAQCVILH